LLSTISQQTKVSERRLRPTKSKLSGRFFKSALWLAPILLEADRTTFTFVIEIALVIVVAGECASDEFEFLN